MKKRKGKLYCLTAIIVFCLLPIFLISCSNTQKNIKIGVSLGVGEAERWVHEKTYMEQKAFELGAEIEVRLNKTDQPKTQQEDCFEMIDQGIDVLILTPRDALKTKDILDYAKQKGVPVVNYARIILGEEVDLFVGYDSNRIGQKQGQYLSELINEGDYIILRGDVADNNATLLYEGAMKYLNPIKEDINILLDAPVPGWSTEEAKTLIREAIVKNQNQIDAILAPNDKLAGACVEVLKELGITKKVEITGMDAELDALKRVREGKQSITVYMDLKILANTAVEEACHIVRKETVNINTEFENQSEKPVNAHLITGQVITKENLDKFLNETELFTKEEVYGE